MERHDRKKETGNREKKIGADCEKKEFAPNGKCAAVHRYRRIRIRKRADDDTQNRGNETNIQPEKALVKRKGRKKMKFFGKILR